MYHRSWGWWRFWDRMLLGLSVLRDQRQKSSRSVARKKLPLWQPFLAITLSNFFFVFWYLLLSEKFLTMVSFSDGFCFIIDRIIPCNDVFRLFCFCTWFHWFNIRLPNFLKTLLVSLPRLQRKLQLQGKESWSVSAPLKNCPDWLHPIWLLYLQFNGTLRVHSLLQRKHCIEWRRRYRLAIRFVLPFRLLTNRLAPSRNDLTALDWKILKRIVQNIVLCTCSWPLEFVRRGRLVNL